MQPASFVVGPGFLSIPDKTVSNIVSGHFIELASLLAKPSDARSASPLICIDGQVIVSQASKPPRRLTDISQWLQTFAIYMLVMVTYWPNCAADLIRYQLLILRTHAQFGGLAWYNYDEAFRRDAAARQVTDWLAMHVELYNFHTSASTRLPPPPVGPVFRESTGASFGTTICRSWNLGRCVRLAQSAVISISAIGLTVGEVTAAFIALVKPLVASLLFPPSPPPGRYSPT